MDSQPRYLSGSSRIREEHRLHAALASSELGAIGALRHRLRAALVRWGVPELADTAELLVSELVTNALLYTPYGARIEVLLDVGGRLRVEVRDDSVQLPRPRRAADTATSGRGLVLVEALADDWGVSLRGDGKITWFELTAA
ncbi:anti-sigma regulatory factor (Ser/Thr protein kinase) [Kitasatospora sp. MAA4]|uniref:ATP-binding protein n=1 Tax=Kitasatospora sp. MAA4 TaxID=3035093 RepID=UPI002476CB37|nr:ATP-binding protein [Kitasatospora sp. MAA4]MDH6132462.1 anti-sigma regulatory factor (Ser/Thr protein kinase) [Kitasatospora sp. MAA4]